jgi:hypothetical protein
MVEEHLRKVTSQQRDYDARSPIFVLAYRASTHDITGCYSVPPPDKELPSIDHAADLVD